MIRNISIITPLSSVAYELKSLLNNHKFQVTHLAQPTPAHISRYCPTSITIIFYPQIKKTKHLITQIRKQYIKNPIIVLAEAPTIEKQKELFSCGCNLIHKLINPSLLMAQTMSLALNTPPATQLTLPPFTYYPIRRELRIKKEFLTLSPNENSFMLVLANRMPLPVSREQIIEEAFNKKTDVNPNSIDTLVSRLRQKIDKVASKLEINTPKVIRTVHGFGYKLN